MEFRYTGTKFKTLTKNKVYEVFPFVDCYFIFDDEKNGFKITGEKIKYFEVLL